MLTVLLYGAIIVAWLWPDKPTGKAVTRLAVACHDWLRRRISWTQVLVGVLMVCAVILALQAMGREGGPIIGSAAPEVFAWFITFDIATYIDVLVLAWTLAALVRIRTAAVSAKGLLRKGRRVTVRAVARMRRAARGRAQPVRRPGPPRKTSDDGHGWWSAGATPQMAWA